MKYKRLDACELRQLCIREDWFTLGSNKQYERMFKLNDSLPEEMDEAESIEVLAEVIAICSDDVSADEVALVLLQAMESSCYIMEKRCYGETVLEMPFGISELGMMFDAVDHALADNYWLSYFPEESIDALKRAKYMLGNLL